MKIAVFSNNHPDFMIGGSERAAYAQFQRIKAEGNDEAVFIASTLDDGLIGHDGLMGHYQGRKDEILVRTPKAVVNLGASENYELSERIMRGVLDQVKPDLVHFHHFFRFGLDTIRFVHEEYKLPVHLTLHEFMLMCHNLGQMVTTDNKLCHEAQYSACARCFPEATAGHFFLRKQFIMAHLAHVERFFAPSHFLAERFIKWGLPEEKVIVQDNDLILPDTDEIDALKKARSKRLGEKRKTLKLGYFGAATELKGLGVLLDAIEALPTETRKKVSLSLYGARLERGTSDFQDKIYTQLEALKDCVKLYGAYAHRDVYGLMAEQDWIVVPSIWWENAPLVIDEAKIVGVPVIASNIGGMKERVPNDGENGIHFRAGSHMDLAETIEKIAD